MLRNLFGLARDARNAETMYRYTDAMLVLDEESANDRFVRAVLAFQTDRLPQAQRDVDWLLERQPEGVDIHIVEDSGAGDCAGSGREVSANSQAIGEFFSTKDVDMFPRNFNRRRVFAGDGRWGVRWLDWGTSRSSESCRRFRPTNRNWTRT